MYRKIFVFYPRGFRTGGPEALHQLVHTLRGLGQDATLVPMPETAHHTRVPSYGRYDAPESPEAEDAADCAIVGPEIMLSKLPDYRHARTFCWWLSIDNAPEFEAERKLLDLAGVGPDLDHIRRTLQRASRKAAKALAGTDFRRVHHLSQSMYAWSFLYTRLNVVPSMLSDFTHPADFELGANTGARGAVVSYNFSKGRYWSEEIAERMPELSWVPIRDMTPAQVVETLAASAVYLDMGPHPGKDRLPREAALAGAVTVVARRGAGAFPDVPIPWQHKVTMASPVESGVEVLRAILADRPSAVAAQRPYLETIRREQAVFTAEARAIFVDGTLEFGAEGPPVRDV